MHGSDADAAHAALDERDAALAELDCLDDALFDGENGGDAAAVARVVETLRRMADAGGEIATVAVRAAIREECL